MIEGDPPKINHNDDNFKRDMEDFADEIEDKKPFVTPEELELQQVYKKLAEETP